VTINNLKQLRRLVGDELGVTDWHEVTQEAVDQFAAVTGDDHWMHTDPARAAQSRFGGTIAHGYYTLALAGGFSYGFYSLQDIDFGVNYGVNRVRFPAPLPVGDRVRMRMFLAGVDDVPGGAQIRTELTFETDRGGKPVCVAEMLERVYLD
jgi:acyl dehydratase